jgi:hypothetical protein
MTRNSLHITLAALGVVLSACATAGTGAGYTAWEDPDGLSGATIARVSAGAFAYVDRVAGAYVLKTINADRPQRPAAQRAIGDNAALAASDGKTVALLTSGTGGLPRTIRLYDGNLEPLGNDIIFPGAPLPHPEGAFALADPWLVTGWRDPEADKTYISVYDLAGSRPPAHTDTSAVIGNLVTLAARGNYIIAGGSAGTAVYQIDPRSLGLSPVSAADGKRSHWMKSSDLYVLESKEAEAEVKVWRWGDGAPEALGSVTVPDTFSGSAVAVKALQFDGPHTACLVSATGGLVYRLDLARAAEGESAKTLLFSYPRHDAGTTTHEFFAWMIEKVSHSGSDYFVITGGYGSMENPRGAAGVALVFQDPAPGSVSPVSTVYYPARVRILRVLEDSAGNFYFAAKDTQNKLGVYRIN